MHGVDGEGGGEWGGCCECGGFLRCDVRSSVRLGTKTMSHCNVSPSALASLAAVAAAHFLFLLPSDRSLRPSSSSSTSSFPSSALALSSHSLSPLIPAQTPAPPIRSSAWGRVAQRGARRGKRGAASILRPDARTSALGDASARAHASPRTPSRQSRLESLVFFDMSAPSRPLGPGSPATAAAPSAFGSHDVAPSSVPRAPRATSPPPARHPRPRAAGVGASPFSLPRHGGLPARGGSACACARARRD